MQYYSGAQPGVAGQDIFLEMTTDEEEETSSPLVCVITCMHVEYFNPPWCIAGGQTSLLSYVL